MPIAFREWPLTKEPFLGYGPQNVSRDLWRLARGTLRNFTLEKPRRVLCSGVAHAWLFTLEGGTCAAPGDEDA